MATIVFFHAHPDDESISTGGSILRAREEGHRVVVVTATRGEEGEVDDRFMANGRSTAEVRSTEMSAAVGLLGIDRHEYLGYRDSGMMGTATNEHHASFWQADVDEAAQALAVLLDEEAADVVTLYDSNGGYGHPDHIQVHRVGHRAADLAATPAVFEVTMNRDEVRQVMGELELGDAEVGLPPEALNTRVDVGAWLETKLAAIRAHASQIPEDGWLFNLPTKALEALLGIEWYSRSRPDPNSQWSWLFPQGNSLDT